MITANYWSLLSCSWVEFHRVAVSFMKPGAIHRARFMAKLIYALKMTKRERAGLGEFCVFGVAVYIKSWFLYHLPTTATPANDLRLLKYLAGLDSAVAKAALKKLCGQL